MSVAEDGRSEAEEGFVKDDGVNERSVGEVDLREGVLSPGLDNSTGNSTAT